MSVNLQDQKISRSVKAYLFILSVKAVWYNWDMKLSKGLRTFLVVLNSSLGSIRKLWCISAKIIKCSVAAELGCASLGVFWLDKPSSKGSQQSTGQGCPAERALCLSNIWRQQSLFKLYFPQVCTWAISQGLCKAPPAVLWLKGDLLFVVSVLGLASSTYSPFVPDQFLQVEREVPKWQEQILMLS